MSWVAVNQYIEQRGGSVTVHMTIREIDEGTGVILGSRTISATTGENNPNLQTVLANNLNQQADIAKADVVKEKGTVVVVGDFTAGVTTHLNS